MEKETPVLHALEAAASAREAANRQQALEDGDYEAGYAAGRLRSLLATSSPRADSSDVTRTNQGE